MLIGYAEPLTRSKLKALYPDHATYVQKVEESVRKLVAGRWLTPISAKRIQNEAAAANIP
jgi:hypothetical protein